MLSRIKKIIDEKGLSISAFADEIGVKRPAMTHTLTGRNNPSLDIVTKILEAYPDVSSEWLMFGKGQMKKSSTPVQSALFDEEEMSNVEESIQKHEIETKSVVQEKEIASSPVETSPIIPIRVESNKQISKIMLFYSDNTFETFIKEEPAKR